MKNKIITVILSLMLIALPLAIMPGTYTYNTPKIYVLGIGGAVLLVMLILNRKKFNFDKKDYVILAFAALICLSTINANNIKTRRKNKIL